MSRRKKPKYFLVDAQDMHRQYPKRFWYASEKQLDSLRIGDAVKVCIDDCERVWLTIVDMDFNKPVMERKFTGTMGNQGIFVKPNMNDLIEFEARHIYTYLTKEEISQGKIV